jgi:hypothetical protein
MLDDLRYAVRKALPILHSLGEKLPIFLREVASARQNVYMVFERAPDFFP